MKQIFSKWSMGIAICAILISCSDKDNEIVNPEPDNTPDPVPEEIITDLSSEELANCYIVQAPGKYKFLADNKFNLGEGLPVPPEINPTAARLVWQTEENSIISVELIKENEKPFVVFEVNEATGNALISVENSQGEIEWSWHIWMPEEEISSISTDTGYEIMNMNLGALNNNAGDPGSYGMLYQWGRKDPFPASATLTGNTSTVSAPMYDIEGNPVAITNSDWTNLDNNNLKYAISHPTVCLSNSAQYAISRDWLSEGNSDNTLWGCPDGAIKDDDNNFINKGAKTCYDPSPAGWRVPSPDVFQNFTTTGGYAWELVDFNIADINNDNILDLDDYNFGWHFNLNGNTSLYFPAASRFDGTYAMLMGSMSGLWGNYWSNSPAIDVNGGALAVLAFQIKDMYGNDMVTLSPAAIGSKADAYSIRCIRDVK